MKKILLFGKFNEMAKNLNAFLSEKFQIQLCSENMEVARGILKIVKPDMVIVSLIGLYGDIDGGIFSLMSNDYPEIPVLTIGTESECSTYLKYYKSRQFVNLIRPVSNSDILKACYDRLHIREGEEEKGPKHILIVDDSPVILRSMKAMLEKKYQVSVATSGSQAMTSIGRKRPDLILLDYEMPVCDGKMTLEMIRQDDEMKDIPVIFLTGVADKAHIEAVLKLKPAGYFLKPAAEETLMKAIADVVGE